MTGKQICMYCKAWREMKDMVSNLSGPVPRWEPSGVGECRRHAPTLNAQNERWPSSIAEDWCLDFVERPIDPEDREARLLGTEYLNPDEPSTFEHISEPVNRVVGSVKVKGDAS